jgi:hypothetical protein
MRKLVTIKPVVRPGTATALLAGAALVWAAGGSLADGRTSAEAARPLNPAAIHLVTNETVLPTTIPRTVPTWRDGGGSDHADGSSGSDNGSTNCADHSCNINVNVGGRNSSSGGSGSGGHDEWRHGGGPGRDWDDHKDGLSKWWKKLFDSDRGGHHEHHDKDWDDHHGDKHDRDINININHSHDGSDGSDDEDGSPKGHHHGGGSSGGTSQASAASDSSGINAAVQELMATIQAAVQQFVSAVVPGA